jgi:lipopolysaccharide/colanic/teichoic acid biosynthesis glycosyltransferase
VADSTSLGLEASAAPAAGSTPPRRPFYAASKRLFDIAAAGAALTLCGPLLLAAAIAVSLDSRGGVFFRQERVGRNFKPFWIYKFRTMVADAERHGGQITFGADRRITRVGRILRKTKIDELPQLINIVRGDMSLVGPRPLPVRDYQGFDQDRQRRRFSVRPGLTCLWQINGRSAVPFEHWMDLDIQYIDHWSLWLDLKILAKTIPAVLRGTGAA